MLIVKCSEKAWRWIQNIRKKKGFESAEVALAISSFIYVDYNLKKASTNVIKIHKKKDWNTRQKM